MTVDIEAAMARMQAIQAVVSRSRELRSRINSDNYRSMDINAYQEELKAVDASLKAEMNKPILIEPASPPDISAVKAELVKLDRDAKMKAARLAGKPVEQDGKVPRWYTMLGLKTEIAAAGDGQGSGVRHSSLESWVDSTHSARLEDLNTEDSSLGKKSPRDVWKDWIDQVRRPGN